MSLSKRLREAAQVVSTWDGQEDETLEVLLTDAADALEAQGEWVSVERSMLERIPRESIAMFQEYRDQYGRDEDDALVAACNEILEGINAYLLPTPPTEDA